MKVRKDGVVEDQPITAASLPLPTGASTEATLQTLNGLMGTVTYDYTAQTQGATTDTWTFRSGGSGGTIVRVIVITYTDSGKGTIANVERTT